MTKHILWSEDARPKTIADCILPDGLKKTLQAFVDSKTLPTLLFFGGPGIGKTSAAIAMCEELGIDYMFLNGSSERGIDVLRTKIVTYASSVSFGGGQKAIIIDEADGLTQDAQKAFRGAIEEFSSNCSFIFTVNNKDKIIEPLLSRCAEIDFKIPADETQKIAMALLKRIRAMLEANNVTYELAVLASVVMKFFPDFRKTINEVQKYAAHGPIGVGMLGQINDISLGDLIEFIKKKDFGKMRAWVGQHPDDVSRLYRKLYNELCPLLQPTSVPDLIVLFAKYAFQDGFTADKELNFMGALTEFLSIGVFK